MFGIKDSIAPFLALFGSVSTLVCCALPALFVSLGAGATLAGIVSSAPWLITLSKYKVWTFSVAGALLLFAAIMVYRSRNAACPIDPVQARLCTRLRKINVWVVSISIVLYLTGFFFAFLAVKLL